MAYISISSTGARVLADQCRDCIMKDPSVVCPVANLQKNFNIDQCGNDQLTQAMDLLVTGKGVCLMKKMIDAHYRRRPFPLPKDVQQNLFGELKKEMAEKEKAIPGLCKVCVGAGHILPGCCSCTLPHPVYLQDSVVCGICKKTILAHY